MADLHHTGVMPLEGGFADHAEPPIQHGVENAKDAGAEHIRTDPEARELEALHGEDEADRHDEGGDRADQRPRARVYEVKVVVGLGMGLSHLESSPSASIALRFRTLAPSCHARITVSASPRLRLMSQRARRSSRRSRCRTG